MGQVVALAIAKVVVVEPEVVIERLVAAIDEVGRVVVVEVVNVGRFVVELVVQVVVVVMVVAVVAEVVVVVVVDRVVVAIDKAMVQFVEVVVELEVQVEAVVEVELVVEAELVCLAEVRFRSEDGLKRPTQFRQSLTTS